MATHAGTALPSDERQRSLLGSRRFGGASGPRLSAAAAPVILIEVAELIEAALQFVRPAALLLCCLPPRHISAPLEVGLSVSDPGWASQATAEAAVSFSLDHSDTGVNFA